MDRAIEIMRSRVDRLGVAESEIRKQGEDQILIELPGVHDAARAAEIVGTTAQLEFYKLEDDVVGPTKGPVENPVIPNETAPSRSSRPRRGSRRATSRPPGTSSTPDDKQLAGPGGHEGGAPRGVRQGGARRARRSSSSPRTASS